MFAILLSDVTSLYLVICAYCGVQCGRTRRGARARPAHGVLADCTPRSVRQAEGRKAGATRTVPTNPTITFQLTHPSMQVLMSATLQTDTLISYFRTKDQPVPFVHLGGSVFPVQVRLQGPMLHRIGRSPSYS